MKLQVCFNSEKEFKEAVDFVANESVFYGEPNEQWQMIEVECINDADANANEKTIETELTENGFTGFYFEIEN